jgi:uncharacterized protein (TIGR02246 family)
MTSDEAAVADVLVRYERALNTSSVDGALALYASDGVFMPQNSASAVGSDAIKTAYAQTFQNITLRVQFNVLEIRQLSPQWVFARTTSSGTSTKNANGVRSREGNQELFLFQKVGDDWKIARYCFSTTNPPGGD